MSILYILSFLSILLNLQQPINGCIHTCSFYTNIVQCPIKTKSTESTSYNTTSSRSLKYTNKQECSDGKYIIHHYNDNSLRLYKIIDPPPMTSLTSRIVLNQQLLIKSGKKILIILVVDILIIVVHSLLLL